MKSNIVIKDSGLQEVLWKIGFHVPLHHSIYPELPINFSEYQTTNVSFFIFIAFLRVH